MKRVFVVLMSLLLFSSAIAEESSIAIEHPFIRSTYELQDTDDNLIALKERLKELEYYPSETTSFNNQFDKGTTRRLKKFQFFNLLPVTGQPDEITQSALFSSDALSEASSIARYTKDPSKEPVTPLIIAKDSMGEWNNVEDMMDFRVQVKNTSSEKVVTAFEIQFLPFNPWDEYMLPAGELYKVSTIATIKPGTKQYSTRILINQREEIEHLYIGISRVKYSDGSIITIPQDEIIYQIWTGPFK